jgi:hypothetical protein
MPSAIVRQWDRGLPSDRSECLHAPVLVHALLAAVTTVTPGRPRHPHPTRPRSDEQSWISESSDRGRSECAKAVLESTFTPI